MSNEMPEINIEPTNEKLAIVGHAESTRDMAPFGDSSFDLWTCNELPLYFPKLRFNILFNLHTRGEKAMWLLPELYPWIGVAQLADDDLIKGRNLDYLQQNPAKLPVYMLKHYDDIPLSVAYPFKQIFEKYGSYFTSSIAYMMALGIEKGYKEIHIYGVDMALREEFLYQRPGVEYLIGYMRGMGIKVYFPPKSMICNNDWIYALENKPSSEGLITVKHLDDRIAQIRKHRVQVQKQGYMLEGAEMTIAGLMKRLEIQMRESGILSWQQFKSEADRMIEEMQPALQEKPLQ